jgi:hypothetical protein
MHHRLRPATRLASVGFLVAAAAAAASLAVFWPQPAHASLTGYGRSDQAVPAATRASSANTRLRFLIGGSVGGMFPGKSRPLTLTILNPNKVEITVTSITTAVGNASPGCPASDFSVTPFAGSLTVLPFHVGHTTVTATMAHSAPNACQGEVFPLFYSGMGRVP